MEINEIIAQNLKILRQERNYSLGQLAELTGISKVMLSQIEKSDTNPTINTICKIAKGLKVPYTSLMNQRVSDTIVVRRDETIKQEDGHFRIYRHFLTTEMRNFELFKMELDGHSFYVSGGHTEHSQEYIIIIKGCLELHIADEIHELNSGDSICFNSALNHTYYNNGEEEVSCVMINYYPL